MSNTQSIGAAVKDAVDEARNGQNPAQKSWPGLGLFNGSYGGAASPEADINAHPGREGPYKPDTKS